MKKILVILMLALPMMALGQSAESSLYYEKGTELYNAQKYEEAIPFFEKSAEIEENEHDTTHRSSIMLGLCWNMLSANYYNIGNYTEAIRCGTQELEIYKNALGSQHLNYATSLINLSTFNYFIGNYQEAVRLGTQANEILKKNLGEEDPNYILSLKNLTNYNSNIGNYQEAVRLGTQAMEIEKRVLGEEHQNYALSLYHLARFHSELGNTTEAIKLGTKAMEIQKRVIGEEHPDYALSLNNLAKYYSDLGDNAEAVRLGTKAMEIQKKILGEEHPYYILSLNNLIIYYVNLGNYTDAIKISTQVTEIQKKVLGEEHPDYVFSLNNLKTYYFRLGNYTEAVRINTQVMEIRKKVLGEEHPDYAQSLNSLAVADCHIGNYTEAIRLETQAMEIYKKVFGEENDKYAQTLHNLAGYNSYIGNYTEAIRLETQAMEIYKKTNGEENPSFASSLNNLASFNSKLGNYTEAIRLGTQGMEIQKKILGEGHTNIATSLNNLAGYYSKLGNDTEAIRLGKQSMDIYQKVLGDKHPDYANALFNMAGYYLQVDNKPKAAELFNEYYSFCKSHILTNFATMTYSERSNFWNIYSFFFTKKIVQVAEAIPTPNQISLAYNGQLLSKGLTLNTELEMQKLIEQSNDPTFIERYNRIRSYRTTLDNLYQVPIDKRQINVDSLLKEIEKEERILVESSKELGDYTKNISIQWEDVQKNLKTEDIAIEFANFTDTSNQVIYVALIIKKGMSSPELVKLNFLKKDAANYSSPTLYNKIWKPLEKYLQGVQNVYFSPTSRFHNIGIEYLPDGNGEIFAKKYNAYRLSSTRELALNHTSNPNKKASVYGGIVYNFDETDWQNVAEENADRAGKGLTFLKAAKVESEEITTILKEGSFDVEFGTDKDATEGNFKKLSGSGIKILHVATHGFYEPESKKTSFANILSSGDENITEDRSLSRSGLFLAGANTFLDPEQRQFIPEGVDDGILTAKEISRMDFNGLDLVVLSACQTGLGKVTGEGVFGLQRGFKKAGAQTIVMSLWNVSDKPTKELMTDFYRNLVAGKSKREAFILAQDKIRLKYIDPKMWAGFIMVDGY